MIRESVPLLFKNVNSDLSLFFATLCIVDIFGVFPIIALPSSIVQCGLFGIPLVFVVFGLQIYTAALLGKSWIVATTLDPMILRKNRYPLAAVTELTLGPRARTIVTFLLDLTIFGCGIPNLLVASQNLQMFGVRISDQRFDVSFCYWLLVVGMLLCPFMWLGSPRDMKWLAMFSCVTVIFTAILIWWCIINDDRIIDHIPIPTSPTWDKFISGYGMLAFLFDIHPTLMTVQVDMHNPRDINKAVILSFFVSVLLFGITAGLAMWKYGGSITANILQIVPTGFAINGAILLAALQLCLSSALGHSALFQHFEDKLRIDRSCGWKRCAIRSIIVFCGVAVGEMVPRFDIVMALIGGSLMGPLIFILPPLMYARAIALKNSANRILSPEIYSATVRQLNSIDTNSDPRIHSRSVYDGFLGVTTIPHRHSYVYYYEMENEIYDDERTEGEEINREDNYSNVINLNESSLMRKDHQEEAIFIDASQPSLKNYRRQELLMQQPLSKSHILSDLKQTMNWFGYLIVIIGIGITISSTYINIKNTIRYVRFTPPCIVNATIV
ncbi:PREDICTED: proton-coupled amino acid transporter 3 isoform X2 [Polistes dominula]|uniref:Proton-coupled amino acid transporter 3 isoform X2 n=1 Tax=Polistes dominula TaxID=743375 RepID=A0ABM1ICR1_POLDO|nr:PREDICTED: proton-coupled amino acid transporter 3 isoform X2 [Polistes dominula]